jgi:RND family efflux transporter MFP subunit
MMWGDLRKVIRYIHAVTDPSSSGGPTDRELLDRYVDQRDEAAFELLLWRHGAMVLNVCRRVLDDEHNAEDAFQATFLAFVRKARSIVRREAVAGWLYRVAYRVALDAQSKDQKTAQRETHGVEQLATAAAPEPGWHELRPLLDDEINRLPARLRIPLVLCYLEGKTNEEAARQLGCPPGTIFSRLARGRELLRHRLIRRGVMLSVGGLIALLSKNAASATVSALLVGPTCKTALAFATAQSAAGTASARVIALAEGVLKAMYLTKLKTVAALVLVMGVLLAGGIMTHRALQAAPQEEADRDKLAKPDDGQKPGQEAKKDPAVVQVMTPHSGGLERKTVVTGTVQALAKAEIFVPVSGVLKNLTVDIGDRVKRGDLLAEIDAPLLALEEKQAAVAVKQAQGLVREAEARRPAALAEAEVAKAVIQEKEAALASAKASAAFHQQQYARMKELLATKTVDQTAVDEKAHQLEAARALVRASQAALANAEANVKVNRSKVAQADAALETARAGLDFAELGLEKARYSLNLTRITAPFDGVVTQRNYFSGDSIRADPGGRLPLLTVVRMDTVRVVVDIPNSDVPLTQPGLPVDLRTDLSSSERLTGYKVSRIGVVEDEKTGTMRAEIDVPNPKVRLRPGMFVQATIHLSKGPPDALRVPRSALLRIRDDKYAVYVVRDGKAHRTLIELSPDRGGSEEVEVRAGLKSTDRIIIDAKGLTGEEVPVEIKKEPDRK